MFSIRSIRRPSQLTLVSMLLIFIVFGVAGIIIPRFVTIFKQMGVDSQSLGILKVLLKLSTRTSWWGSGMILVLVMYLKDLVFSGHPTLALIVNIGFLIVTSLLFCGILILLFSPIIHVDYVK